MAIMAPGDPGSVNQPGQPTPTLLGKQGGLPAPAGARITGVRSLRRMTRAVTSNRKATAGALLLLFFFLVALFPGVIAHDNPNAEIYPRHLGPSAQHLLGTTAFGQDLFAQLVWGTRPVVLIAAALGVSSDVFREAFSHVRPAPAGTRPDPAVSVPRAKLTRPAATATAEPALEPPGI